jgi:CheY-like chemotaxis protein
MSGAAALVLCAEDEESDAILLQNAFRKAGSSHPLRIVKDGREAVDYLSGVPPYEDRGQNPLPALLLLDLKMPRLSGFDVLRWLATRPELSHIPVVVLSSSPAEPDIRKATQMGARDYVVKPNSFAEYVKVIESILARWLAASPP